MTWPLKISANSQIASRIIVLEHQKQHKYSNLVSHFGEFDYLIIEGLKSLKLPRITVFRDEIIEDFIPFSDAFATNVAKFSANGDKFGLDDIDQIINWIDKNAKRV